MFLHVPALINDWFDQRWLTFMYLCFGIFTGIGGTVFNPIGSAIIRLVLEGWRACYLIFALVMLCRNTLHPFVVREKLQDLYPIPLYLPPLLTRKTLRLQRLSSTDISADDAMKYPEFYMVAVSRAHYL